MTMVEPRCGDQGSRAWRAVCGTVRRHQRARRQGGRVVTFGLLSARVLLENLVPRDEVARPLDEALRTGKPAASSGERRALCGHVVLRRRPATRPARNERSHPHGAPRAVSAPRAAVPPRDVCCSPSTRALAYAFDRGPAVRHRRSSRWGTEKRPLRGSAILAVVPARRDGRSGALARPDLQRRPRRRVRAPRALLLDRLHTLGPAFFRKMPSGEIMSRATNDLTQVRLLLGFGVLNVGQHRSSRSRARSTSCSRISAKLTLAALATLPAADPGHPRVLQADVLAHPRRTRRRSAR